MSLKEVVAQAYLEARQSRELDAGAPRWMEGSPPSTDAIVTHLNYMGAPRNRWGFKNLEKLTRSTTISRGRRPVSTLIHAPRDLSGFQFWSKRDTQVTVQEHLEATFTDGFIVLKDGKCIYESYFDGQKADDRHIMFSATKSIVGLIAEDFVTKGVIDDSALSTAYVPELAGSAFGDATVRQIMNMTVGIDYLEVYDVEASSTAQFGYASGLWDLPEAHRYTDNICDFLKQQAKKGEHGVRFSYVTACTEAMAWIVERATGQSIASLVESVWSKLGCERDAYFVNDAHGRVCAGGGFNATLRDIARFGLLVAQKGQWNGEQLFDTDTVDRLFQGADPAPYALNEEFSLWTPGASYRSQWYVYAEQSVMAVGIHGQVIYINQPGNVVIVKQSSSPEAETALDLDTIVMLRELAERV